MSKDQKDKTIHIPVGDTHIAEVSTEFNVTLSAEASAGLEAVLNAPEGTSFSGFCEIGGLDPKTDFIACDLEGTSFFDEGDFFVGANFRDSILSNSKWNEGTNTYGILLEDAELDGATGLTEEMLAKTYINEKTRLPEGIDRERVAHLHKQLDMPQPPPYREEDGFITFEVPATLHRKQ